MYIHVHSGIDLATSVGPLSRLENDFGRTNQVIVTL